MAANRTQTMGQAFKTVWSRGGVAGLYQGLIPWVSTLFPSSLPLTSLAWPSGLWSPAYEFARPLSSRADPPARVFGLGVRQAWIEASTKGAVLIFAASEIESATSGLGLNPAVSGLLGGMGGGIAQAYATMGELNSPV